MFARELRLLTSIARTSQRNYRSRRCRREKIPMEVETFLFRAFARRYTWRVSIKYIKVCSFAQFEIRSRYPLFTRVPASGT